MNTDKKNIIWNAVGAGVSAFNSLFFLVIATRINGSQDAGIFSYGFATACILYVLGSYIIRAFQVTDISEKFTDSDYIYNRIITCVMMLLLSVGFVLIKGYTGRKAAVLFLLCAFKCAEAFSETLYAIVQKREQLYKLFI